jgi:hypothetical protein
MVRTGLNTEGKTTIGAPVIAEFKVPLDDFTSTETTKGDFSVNYEVKDSADC